MNKTEAIFQTTAPYNNYYQDIENYKRLLFVCSAGLLRSATGSNLYSQKGYNTRACGTHEYALVPLSANLIQWADKIIFVNKENYVTALSTFAGTELDEPLRNKSKVLDIPDQYSFMDPHLVKFYQEQLGEDV